VPPGRAECHVLREAHIPWFRMGEEGDASSAAAELAHRSSDSTYAQMFSGGDPERVAASLVPRGALPA